MRSAPSLSPVLVSMCVHCVEIRVQNIILRHPFFKEIYSKRQCMHSYAYATFKVMWIGNIHMHDMYIISYCLNLANEIIMWWTVRVYNEAWSALKFIGNVLKKRLYFKTLQSIMVYLSISMCFIYFRRAILEAKDTLTLWRQNLTSRKSIVNCEWLPLVNHSTYNEKTYHISTHKSQYYNPLCIFFKYVIRKTISFSRKMRLCINFLSAYKNIWYFICI